MVDGALYFEQSWYPFFDGDDLDAIPEALEESMWTQVSSPPGPVPERDLADGARILRERSSRAIIGLFGGNLLETGQFLYRSDKFLMMLAADPGHTAEFLDRLTAHHLERLEAYLKTVGPTLDIILFGDDLGMQTGPQMSPDMYRSLFKPRHQALWRAAKEMADVKVMLHCCGGVRELLPDLIEAGLDAINPVQIRALGMEPSALKADFGSQIVFWGGGCDTQEVLPNRRPSDIADHVRENIAHFEKKGGFVFQQVHNILSNVPAENVAAMFREVNRLRGMEAGF